MRSVSVRVGRMHNLASESNAEKSSGTNNALKVRAVQTVGMQCPTSKIAINPDDTYTVKVTYENAGVSTSKQIQIVALIIYEESPLTVYYDTTSYLAGTMSMPFYPTSVGSQETITLLRGVNKLCHPYHPVTLECGMHIWVIPFDPSQGLGVFSYLEDENGNIIAVNDAELANTLSQAGAYAADCCDAIINWSEPQC